MAEDPEKAKIFREIVDVEQRINFWIQPLNGSKVELEAVFRFQHNRILNNGLIMLGNAWLKNAPCPVFQVSDLCKCFSQTNDIA